MEVTPWSTRVFIVTHKYYCKSQFKRNRESGVIIIRLWCTSRKDHWCLPAARYQIVAAASAQLLAPRYQKIGKSKTESLWMLLKYFCWSSHPCGKGEEVRIRVAGMSASGRQFPDFRLLRSQLGLWLSQLLWRMLHPTSTCEAFVGRDEDTFERLSLLYCKLSRHGPVVI